MDGSYLPELDYEMDGIEPINLNLAWKNPSSGK